MENVVAGNDGKNRHGYPRGYHFVPRKIELIRLLEEKLAGRPLPPPFPNIFHDVRILDFHPDELYEAYKAHKEAGCIYFFSRREFPTPRGDRGRPVRVAKDGGNWKASGGGRPVSTMKRGGVNVGYELTMVFYEKKKPGDDKSSGKTDWGMHEYTRIIGPNKKVADLALYRLYKKKTKQADQHGATLSDGPLKLEELPSPDPTASTSQAQAQARVWQPHDYYHQDAFGAPAPVPGPSSWPTPAANPLHAGSMELTGSLPAPLMVPSLQATAVNHTPASPPQQALSLQATATPMSPQQQAVNHLDDEFKVWCEMQQEQPAASPCWFPMPGDDNLPMLMNEENDLYACTMDELLAGLHDEADMSIQEPDTNHEVKSSKSNQ